WRGGGRSRGQLLEKRFESWYVGTEKRDGRRLIAEPVAPLGNRIRSFQTSVRGQHMAAAEKHRRGDVDRIRQAKRSVFCAECRRVPEDITADRPDLYELARQREVIVCS